MRHRWIAVWSAVVVAASVASPAGACSCAYGDPRDRLIEADAAIVGEFVGSRPNPNSDSFDDETVYTFRVVEEVKGQFDEMLDVYSASNGAACGLEVQPGQNVGLFLYLEDTDEWQSNLCSQIAPDELQRAAEPLPRPTGSGRPRVIVGGSFGRPRTIALDARGRTLAYGSGQGNRDAVGIEVCPGGERALELTDDYPTRPHLAVRDIDSFDKVRELELPRGDVLALSCRDRAGRRALVFVHRAGAPRPGRIFEVRRRTVQVVRRVEARVATFGGESVYLASGGDRTRLQEVDLGSGRIRDIARLPASPDRLAVSPSGDYLAAFNSGPRNTPRLYLVGVDTGRIRSTRLLRRGSRERYAFGNVDWWTARRLVWVPDYGGRARVFDLRLNRRGRLRLSGPSFDIADDRLYALSERGLLRARLPRGPVRVMRRRFPSPILYAVAAVPRRR